MPSFKLKILSAAAGILPALVAGLPQSLQPKVLQRGGELLDLDLQRGYAQATFSVPCAGCLGADDSLILSFKAHASEKSCVLGNVTVNGVHLPQEWHGDFASGTGSYSAVTDTEESAWFTPHNWDLQWESACLRNSVHADDAVAQVLTLNIESIDGKPLETPSGFTISFNQQSPPELLRLEARPNRLASKAENAESWRAPPPELRLTLGQIQAASSTAPKALIHLPVEKDIEELRALQAELRSLQEAVTRKQNLIKARLREESQTFTKELRQCHNISCVAKIIADGAHGAWRVLYIRLLPHHTASGMGSNKVDTAQRVWRAGDYKQIPEHSMKIGTAQVHNTSLKQEAPENEDASPSSPSQGESRRLPPPDSPYVIALEIVLGILCCGCLVTAIRHHCSSLRTRTERAALKEERRNARAYRRAARKLAWQNWWHGSWRGNWRDRRRIEDYEEKRSLISHQETILEGAVQEEIRQLRAAHGLVNDIVRAEEGRPSFTGSPLRIHCQHAHTRSRGVSDPSQPPSSPGSVTSTYPPTSLPEMPSRPLSRTDSLPGYRSDASSLPPAYEEEEEDDGLDLSSTVADGFRQYRSVVTITRTRAASSTTSSSEGSDRSRWTPDSSIVDVSPRPSADTLRYTGTGETCRT